jgi:hypothetical protein
MKAVRWQYPGDPVLVAQVMTGREFLATTPRPREIVAHFGDHVERRDIGDEVICDQCSADVAPDDRCAVTMNRLYCGPCLDQWITPYIVAVLLVLFCASSAHAADRTPLASLIAASVADAVTTERAIAHVPFAYEANPLLTGSAVKREASKAACTAGLVWGLARLGHSHPRLATALAWTATGSLTALAAHNAAIARTR